MAARNCADEESLAAFLDCLDSVITRAETVAHLMDCDVCLELTTDTVETLEDLRIEGDARLQ